MAKNDTSEADTVEGGDAPLIDLNDASIKKLMARAKKRGVITYDELNEALPAGPDVVRADRGHHVGDLRDGRQHRRE